MNWAAFCALKHFRNVLLVRHSGPRRQPAERAVAQAERTQSGFRSPEFSQQWRRMIDPHGAVVSVDPPPSLLLSFLQKTCNLKRLHPDNTPFQNRKDAHFLLKHFMLFTTLMPQWFKLSLILSNLQIICLILFNVIVPYSLSILLSFIYPFNFTLLITGSQSWDRSTSWLMEAQSLLARHGTHEYH